MKIILYVAGMPFNGKTIAEGKSLGGSETAGYYVAKELANRGHDVIMFTNITSEQAGKFDGVVYMPIGTPTQQAPFGKNFADFAENIPCDVLIGQRIPAFFGRPYNTKISLWWTHDLALKRHMGGIAAQLWNMDGVLTVSEFHKDQVKAVYGIKEEFIHVLRNGIDPNLYKRNISLDRKRDSKTLLYTSRPERGLENLVKPGGIMEKLFIADPEIRLVVTSYENTVPEMAPFYQYLAECCQGLPNVTIFDTQGKEGLAQIMQGAWLHVYPTEFKEVSCITAMEAQAAGTPIMTTPLAALPETLKDAGVIFIPLLEKGGVDIDAYANTILNLRDNLEQWHALRKVALKKAESYDWKNSVDTLEKTIEQIFAAKTSNPHRLCRYYLYMSDILAAKDLCAKYPAKLAKEIEQISKEYAFMESSEKLQNYYDALTDWNLERHYDMMIDTPDSQYEMPRAAKLWQTLPTLKSGSLVLDYGCNFGQQTRAMALRFPGLKFIGVDFSLKSIEFARSHLEKNPLSNLSFYHLDSWERATTLMLPAPDFIYCAEVLEHTPDPTYFVQKIEQAFGLKKPKILFTVPSDYCELHDFALASTYTACDIAPFKQHLSRFEPEDLHEIFKDKKDLKVTIQPWERNMFGTPQGHTTFEYTITPKSPTGQIDYSRKHKYQAPIETLSVCIITKATAAELGKTLDSVKDIAAEIIIGIDGKEGIAWAIAKQYGAITFEIESPVKIGFDVARNFTIERATGDWILWIDSDESLQWPEKLVKFLRHNQYEAYAIHQHHFTAEPPGVMRTDIPARLFRNHLGIKFFGIVHEHPYHSVEKELQHVFIIPQNEVAICHSGYNTENTRRRRFERNWPLMQKDHAKYPTRELGKFLWIRDLSHINRFEFERTKQITPLMYQRAEEALKLWRELLKTKKSRLMNDCLPYVTECVDLLTRGGGIVYEVGLQANWNGLVGDHINGSAIPKQQAKFLNNEDIKIYTNAILEEKLDAISGDYL